MQQAYDDGKVVEADYAMFRVLLNEDLDNSSSIRSLNALDGVADENLRRFAKDAAKFGKAVYIQA